MHRVVVTTHQDQVISSANVPKDRLVEHVAGYARRDDLWIYIDGNLLLPEQRAMFFQYIGADESAQAASTRATRPAEMPAPEPGSVATWIDILYRGLDDLRVGCEEVRRGTIQNLQDMQEFARQSTEIHLRMQRELADEAVRQRRLTAQSLADIDLLDRAVKTTQLNDALASARKAFGQPLPVAATSGGFAVGDWVRGLMEFAGKQ